ncbi:MBL fold metallo-hydrolase [bacterium]|nr:MBL fold metallo-hydrolase [bacterium]
MKTFIGMLIVIVTVHSGWAQEPYEIQKIADGVYVFIAEDPTKDVVNGNSILVIGDNGALVFDSGTSLREAKWLVSEIKKLTTKPVKFVVNSHWHWDHWIGNQVFTEAYPQCQIIAHSSTRNAMMYQYPRFVKQALLTQGDMIATFKKELETGNHEGGDPLTTYEKKRWARTYSDLVKDSAETRQYRETLPTMTFDKKLTLYMGAREIQLVFLGNANTRGDAAMILPAEKILVTGDILVAPVPYAFGVSPRSWIGVLKNIASMDVHLIVPGHGAVQTDKSYVQNVIALFESSYEQVAAGRRQGLNAKDAITKVDIEKFRKIFAGDDEAKNWAFTNYYVKPMLDRMYKELGGELGE